LIKLLNDFYVMLSGNGLYFVILLRITSLNTSPLQTLVLIETFRTGAHAALRWQNNFNDFQNFLPRYAVSRHDERCAISVFELDSLSGFVATNVTKILLRSV